MRPIYESAADKEREAAVAAKVQQLWPVTLIKQPDLSPLDFKLYHHGDFWGWAEIKCRFSYMEKYPTWFISSTKVTAGNATGMPYLFIVQWADKLAWLRGDKVSPCKIEVGGREDRNDPRDQEWMAHFPISKFKFF